MTRLGLYVLTVLCALAAPVAAWAGPPFQTDDPEPIGFRHYEFYTLFTVDGTAIETDTAGPAVEFNWGALPNVHLHIIIPVAAVLPSNDPNVAPAGTGPREIGLGDIELGVKFRFVPETKHRPMIGTFTMFELPTGSASRGLGVGKIWYKVPVWVQKSIGPWTTYGGGGATIVSGVPGYRTFPYAGGLVQRDLGKTLTLGTELFYHGAEGEATPQTKSATLLDVGGYYKFRDPGFQLLFCYGHTVNGQTENYGYAGLYWTWGHKSPDKEKAMARLGPPDGLGRF